MENLKVLFPVHIREKIKEDQWFDGLEEIRIRVGQPIELEYADETRYLYLKGHMYAFAAGKK